MTEQDRQRRAENGFLWLDTEEFLAHQAKVKDLMYEFNMSRPSEIELRQGLMKKMLIILVVVLAACLDYAVSVGAGITFEAVMGACCLWFIASEGLSILENVASMGVPVPKILLNLLEIMRQKGDGQEPRKPEQAEEQADE